MFKDKTLLITGGTGSFGKAALNRFIGTDIGEIRIFSRDEKKQDDLRAQYKNSKVKCYIGDVRNMDSVRSVMCGVDYVFHAAALKQVPSCEFFPMEAVRTNIIGTDNVVRAAIESSVERVVCLSTDKAAYPINAMGLSKALMEKTALAHTRMGNQGNTVLCVTRYGNVMCSRGSVIPLFIQQIRAGEPVTVTNPEMTRFMMSLEDAIDLVLFAFENATGGETYVQKSPSSTIGMLAEVVSELFSGTQGVRYIGTRHGEKLYETLLTQEEMMHAQDLNEYFMVPLDSRDLNYGNYFVEGKTLREEHAPYTSHNTGRLSRESLRELLLSLPYIQNALRHPEDNEGC